MEQHPEVELEVCALPIAPRAEPRQGRCQEPVLPQPQAKALLPRRRQPAALARPSDLSRRATVGCRKRKAKVVGCGQSGVQQADDGQSDGPTIDCRRERVKLAEESAGKRNADQGDKEEEKQAAQQRRAVDAARGNRRSSAICRRIHSTRVITAKMPTFIAA